MRFIEKQLSAISKITTEICISDYKSAGNESRLKKLNITHVLDVSDGKERKYHTLQYFRIKIQDSKTENLRTHLPIAFGHIRSCQEAGGKMLVHCQMGQSRSVSIVIAWLMYSDHVTGKKASFSESYLKVQKVRSIASPNEGFCTSLLEFEKELNQYHDKALQLSVDLQKTSPVDYLKSSVMQNV